MKLTRTEFLAVAFPALIGSTAIAADAARRPKKSSVKGHITKVDPDTGRIDVVRSGPFQLKAVVMVDERTKYLRSDEAEGSFDDLAEGLKIEAKGRLNQNASLQASRILIYIPDPQEK